MVGKWFLSVLPVYSGLHNWQFKKDKTVGTYQHSGYCNPETSSTSHSMLKISHCKLVEQSSVYAIQQM